MKKFVALLMAALLVLASVSALADSNSVKPSSTTRKRTPVFVIVDNASTAETYLKALNAADDVLSVFEEKTQTAVKAIVGDSYDVHELVSLRAPGWDQKSAEYLLLEFAAEYKQGTPVSAVLVTLTNGTVEENLLKAKVTADYQVTVYWPVDMMQKIWDSSEAFLVIVNAE